MDKMKNQHTPTIKVVGIRNYYKTKKVQRCISS